MVSRGRIRGGLLAVALAATGCGESGPPRAALHPASGKVIVDGRPAAGVQVRLRPADAPDSLDALVPFGKTGEDGVFTLGTYEAGDGAPTGRYKVTLFWPDRPPGPSHAEDRLGGVYALGRRTTLEATIAEGDNALGPFEVAKPAPRPRKAANRKNASDDPDGLE